MIQQQLCKELSKSGILPCTCSKLFLFFLLVFLFPSVSCAAIYHKVKSGETLYSISWKYGLDYREVARWNRIKPPYTIHVGQRLRLLPSRRELKLYAGSKIKAPDGIPDSKVSRKESPKFYNQQNIHWQWPTTGKIIQTYSDNDPARKGIDISGNQGTLVHAASDGTVVYDGDKFPRLGKVVIIKHDDQFLSTYAHNDKIFVKAGEAVKAGQTIAAMGSSGSNAKQTMLHFEIRKDGTPVNPLEYLPRKIVRH